MPIYTLGNFTTVVRSTLHYHYNSFFRSKHNFMAYILCSKNDAKLKLAGEQKTGFLQSRVY
jgi:hypothetical protein